MKICPGRACVVAFFPFLEAIISGKMLERHGEERQNWELFFSSQFGFYLEKSG